MLRNVLMLVTLLASIAFCWLPLVVAVIDHKRKADGPLWSFLVREWDSWWQDSRATVRGLCSQ